MISSTEIKGPVRRFEQQDESSISIPPICHTRLYALDSCLGKNRNKITEVRCLCKYRENITARPLAAFAEAIKIYSRNTDFEQFQQIGTFGGHMSETIHWI